METFTDTEKRILEVTDKNYNMTKVNRIEIRKAPKSGRQYLILNTLC